MTKIILSLSLLLISYLSFSQSGGAKMPDSVYTAVDEPASFPGGRPAWINYIQKNLDASVPVQNDAKKGRYNVIIKFVVMKDGSLTGFVPETKFHHGLEEEVIRILKLSPKWIPATRNGVTVDAYARQSQLFVVE